MILFLLQCEEQVDTEEFQAYLERLPEIGISDRIMLNHENSTFYSPLSLTVDDSGQAVVVDHSNWSLHLINSSGEIQASSGGFGSGPGEFQIINGLEIGNENTVDVLDKKQNRLSTYDITSGRFELVETISLPDYSPYRIESFHRSDSAGLLGVFRLPVRADTLNNPYLVFRLNADLNQKEKLFEMPGSDKIKMGDHYDDDELGFITKWHMNDEMFYYSNSQSLSWTSIQLENLEHTKDKISNVPENLNTREAQKYITDRLRPIIQVYPEFADAIKKRTNLTYFTEFLVDSDAVYYTVSTFGDGPWTILKIDRETREMSRLEVPPSFVLYGILENTLYGIVHDELQVMLITTQS